MSDDLEKFMMQRAPSPDRPLQGITVLVVEDSRFASEAIRLLCLRSGARIRRADSLAAAHRHLRVYRPAVVIVDMGLPDGSGAELIRELAKDVARVPAILAMSGDETTRASAMKAGADRFLAKPVESLAEFQHSILALLPSEQNLPGPRALSKEIVEPDPMALHDDYQHVSELMSEKVDGPTQDYLAQFLAGLARSAHDRPLAEAVRGLARSRAEGRGTQGDLSRLAGMVQDRLSERRVV